MTTTFDAANAGGEILNRKTGERGSVSSSARDAILSSARAALRRATGLADVEDVAVDPYLEALPELARQDAVARGLAAPRNAADRVRRLLAVVEGGEYARARGGARYVLPAWQPLYAAVAKFKKTRCERASAVLRLQNVAMIGGQVQRPEDLPGRAVVKRWARAQGYDRKAITRMFDAYRLARAECAATHPTLPSLERTDRPELRGVLGLPDLAERLAAAGCTTPARTLGAEGVLRVLAPDYAEALRIFRAMPGHELHSPEWHKRVLGAVSRVAAELLRAGHDASAVDPFELTVRLEGGQQDARENALVAKRRRSRGDAGAAGARTISVPLLQLLMEAAARRAFARSPLELVRRPAAGAAVATTSGTASESPSAPAIDAPAEGEARSAGVPALMPLYFPSSARRDLALFRKAVQRVYASLEEEEPEAWAQMLDTFARLDAHVQATNRLWKLRGQKNKRLLLEHVTYPQLVCVGIPALRRKVLRAQARYHAVRRRHVDENAPAVAEARRRYGSWLRHYLVLALMTDDAMRTANYAGAIAGEHVTAAVKRDASGRWRAFTRVDTRWRGHDDPAVKLKIATDELGAERTRERTVRPGIVDHELLFEYWTDVRLDALVRAGLLASRAAYNPDRDQWALFVSPRRKNAVARRGRYSRTALSAIYGKALHWVCTRVLKRAAVPAWNDPARTTTWRSLFAGHVSRLLVMTYWGGIRQQWTEACMLIDDTPEVAVRSYAKVSARMLERQKLQGPENPNHFDAYLDAIYHRHETPTLPGALALAA